jgi:hypothetical protein
MLIEDEPAASWLTPMVKPDKRLIEDEPAASCWIDSAR